MVARDFDVEGKRVTVVGAARSGIAAAELLARRRARVTLTEMRSEAADAEPLRRLGVQLELGGHRTETLTHADLVVLSPGVPTDQPAIQAARERGVPIIGELELASRWLQGRVVAITGTKGKSTTTALTGQMLSRGIQGDCRRQHQPAERTGVGVDAGHGARRRSQQLSKLEQIETFHPWIAVMLNFSPDHLDRHPNVDACGAAKARIFENQTRKRLGGHQRRRPGVLELARKGRPAAVVRATRRRSIRARRLRRLDRRSSRRIRAGRMA